MDALTVLLFLELPVELARYIIELAALTDRASSLALVRVSKDFREWFASLRLSLHSLIQAPG